jgi:hypothetical protein
MEETKISIHYAKKTFILDGDCKGMNLTVFPLWNYSQQHKKMQHEPNEALM